MENLSLLTPPRRRTQDSKVTSTPKAGRSVASLAPSASSIEDTQLSPGEEESQDSSEMAVETANSSLMDQSDVIVSTVGSKSDSEVGVRRKIRKFTWTGRWARFKPENTNSLYYQVVNSQPHDMECVVVEFFSTYSRNELKGVILLLKLLVDISGAQKLEIKPIYKRDNAAALTKALEIEILKGNEDFLFMGRERISTDIEGLFHDFFANLIKVSYETNILFTGLLPVHLFEFVRCMCYHKMKAICVTGTLCAISILTSCVTLYSKLLVDNAPRDKMQFLEKFSDFFYILYEKNSLIDDPHHVLVKFRCMQAIVNLIKCLPQVFINKRRCLQDLKKFVVNQNAPIRIRALQTCEQLFISETFCQNIERDNMRGMVDVIEGRIIDCDHKVATLAIKILTKALKLVNFEVKRKMRADIVNLLHQEDLILARAAGLFLVTYHRSDHDDGTNLLLALSNIPIIRSEFAGYEFLLVQACTPCCPELTNWALIIKVLLNNRKDEELRKSLLKIMNESARKHLTGRYSKTCMNRQKSEVQPGIPVDHTAFVCAFLPNYTNLLTAFRNDHRSLTMINEFLHFIEFSTCHSNRFVDYYIEAFSTLRDLFEASVDWPLLEKVTKALHNLCEQNEYFEDHAKVLLDGLKKQYSQRLIEQLKQYTSNPDDEFASELMKTSLKISELFSLFDITNLLRWKDIFEVWANAEDIKAVKHLISSCKWHLVWSLRRSGLENGLEVTLIKNCNDFVESCLRILRNPGSNSIAFRAYENLCGLCNIVNREAEKKPQLKKFMIQIDSSSDQSLLMNFTERYVIKNISLPLEKRQKYVSALVDMIFKNVLPADNLSIILRHYVTHNSEFGEIMDYVISEVQRQFPVLPLLILHVIKVEYDEILSKNEAVDVNSQIVKPLKKLTMKFATLPWAKDRDFAKKFFSTAITTAFKSPGNYNILYFLRCFLQHLQREMKDEIYDIFIKLLPAAAKKVDVVLLFASWFKSK